MEICIFSFPFTASWKNSSVEHTLNYRMFFGTIHMF